MASVTILSDNGATSGSAGLKTSGGNDGVLLLQTTTSGGTPTTAITIDNTQTVTFTNQPTYTGGTANGVLYLNGSKAVTSGTALVFDGTTLKNAQSSSGATPSSNGNGLVLDSSGNGGLTIATGASSLGNIFFADSGDSADGFLQYDQSGRSMRFGTATSEKMRLDSSGNLGLGVTPSAWASPFKVIQGGGGGYSSYFGFQSNTYACKTGVNHYYNGSNYVYAANAAAARFDINENNFNWNIAASGTAGNTISFTQAMTLNASGYLAIGDQTSPTTRVDIRGTSANVASTVQIVGTGVSTLLLGQNADGGVIRGQGGNNCLTFWTGGVGDTAASGSGSERARIDSSGNLTMGGGSFVGSYFTMYRSSSANTVAATPSIVLANQNATSGTFMLGGMFGNAYRDVSSSSVVAGVWMEAQNGGAGALAKAGNVYIGAQDYAGGWNTPAARLSVLYTGTIQFNAYGSGSLSTNASGVISASDGRFKTKTRGITNALDKVLQLADAATFYRWNEGTPWHTEYEEIGWVAQDVAAIIPEASPEPEVPIETGDYGEPQVSKFKNYHDRAILAYMASAIKELKAEVDALKGQA